jgi:hypothetical protein
MDHKDSFCRHNILTVEILEKGEKYDRKKKMQTGVFTVLAKWYYLMYCR